MNILRYCGRIEKEFRLRWWEWNGKNPEIDEKFLFVDFDFEILIYELKNFHTKYKKYLNQIEIELTVIDEILFYLEHLNPITIIENNNKIYTIFSSPYQSYSFYLQVLKKYFNGMTTFDKIIEKIHKKVSHKSFVKRLIYTMPEYNIDFSSFSECIFLFKEHIISIYCPYCNCKYKFSQFSEKEIFLDGRRFGHTYRLSSYSTFYNCPNSHSLFKGYNTNPKRLANPLFEIVDGEYLID